MANSVTHSALPFPVKGARFSLAIVYLDADGDPTDPTTPDTERSIDAAAFADCTEEVTTISGSNGVGYITLTGDEMNGSMIAVAAKVASGPKATLATLYPRVLPSISTGTAQAGAAGTITLAAGAPAYDISGCIVKTTGGTGGAGGSGSLNNQARVITAYNTSTKVATVVPDWETNPDSTTTYTILLTDMAANAVAGRFLRPTTDERTLDVSAGGEAGVDWANIGSPTTTVNLSGTTVKTATDVEADTQDIQSRLPAALTAGGNIKADALALSGDTVAADNAEAFFDGTGYAGTNNVIPTVTTATNVTTVNGLAAGVITATAIAADAIGASELAADAAAEIAAAVRTELTTELGRVDVAVSTRLAPTTAGRTLDVSAGGEAGVDWANVGTPGSTVNLSATTVKTATDVEADTADIQTRIPAVLSGGNIKADVLAVNGSTAAAARLALSAANMIPGTVDTTAFTATTTILESDDITEATADHYNGRLILFTSGALIGQVSEITDYALNGGRGRFTYTALTEAPANNDTFLLV